MLPEGDTPNPNAALQVEWFYMSFHRSNRAEYLRSRRKLCNETLATLAEYFESGFNVRMADGTLCKLHDEQVCVKACNKYRHELQACYHDKLKRLANSRRGEHSWRHDCDDSNHGGKSRAQARCQEQQRPQDCSQAGRQEALPCAWA